jgi:hypothetical protein
MLCLFHSSYTSAQLMIVSGAKENFTTFSNEKGFEMIVEIVSLSLPNLEITEISLWILRELILLDIQHHNNCDSFRYLINLLESREVNDIVREQICYSIAEVMQRTPKPQLAKNYFREAEGIASLLNILQHSSNYSPEVSYAAIYTMAESVSECEENRIFIGDTIGYLRLSNVIKATGLQLDTILFEMILEFAIKSSSIRRTLGIHSNGPLTTLSKSGTCQTCNVE